RPMEGGTDFGLRNGGVYRDDVRIRASGNGQVFGMWCVSHSPSGLEAMMLSGGTVVDYYEHESVGHIVPMADGSALCTASGYYMADLSRKRGNDLCIPTVHPNYALAFPSGDNGRSPRPSLPQQGSIVDKSGRNVAELPRMDEMEGQFAIGFQKGFSLDQRYICIPQAKLLVTIPSANDRLVLRKIEVDAAPFGQVEAGAEGDDAAED